MGETERKTGGAGMAERARDLRARAEKLEGAPILTKAALAQEVARDSVALLAELAEAVEGLQNG